MDFAFGQAHLWIEDRGSRELGTRLAALHLIDEIEQRRVLHAREASVETRPRASHGRPGPEPGRLLGRIDAPHEARQLRHGGQGDQVGLHLRYLPPALGARVLAERDVHHGEALRPVFRLHKMDAVDHRVADLAMRVADDHDVRLGIQRGERSRVVFWSHARRVVRRCTEAAVDQHHSDIGAFTVEPRQGEPRRARDAPDARVPAELRAIPEHDTRRRKSGDAHLHGPARQDDRLRKERRAARVLDVRGNVAIGGLLDRAAEEVDAEVEVVVSRRHDIVLQGIERIDDRLGLALVVAAEVGRERIALQQVARVDEHEAWIAGAERFEGSRRTRQPTRCGRILDVVPAEHAAVDVGGRDNDDVGGVRRGGRCRILEREQERGEQNHSGH